MTLKHEALHTGSNAYINWEPLPFSCSYVSYQRYQQQRAKEISLSTLLIMTFTVLISGANRGIGKGLLQRYLLRPNHVVIAANRNPSDPTSQFLKDLPKGEGSRLIIVKVDATSETDASDAVEELQTSHGIDHLDLVIANAGMSTVWPTVADLKIADLQAHMAANAYGVITLYQATRSLLEKSSKEPKFIPIGSRAGCMK